MSFDDIQTASVIEYQFLWKYEALRGESEGRKSRPVAVALRSKTETFDRLFLWPITTKQPNRDIIAVEVPEIEKKRAGLDPLVRQWIVLEELNIDIIPGSYVLEADAKIGEFSRSFFQLVMQRWKQNFSRSKYTNRVD